MWTERLRTTSISDGEGESQNDLESLDFPSPHSVPTSIASGNSRLRWSREAGQRDRWMALLWKARISPGTWSRSDLQSPTGLLTDVQAEGGDPGGAQSRCDVR